MNFKQFKPSSWSIDNKTAIYIVTIIISIWGIMSYNKLPKESFPDIVVPKFFVSTVYAGNSPSNIENTITKPLEKKLKSIPGVKKLTSNSMQDVSLITVEFNTNITIDKARQSVKDKVDEAKSDLPAGLTRQPFVKELAFSELPIMYINIAGDMDLQKLKEYADDLKDRIEGLKEITEVKMVGAPDREIQVNLDMYKMQAMQLTMGDLERSIGYENVTISGGQIPMDGTKRTISIKNEFKTVDELKELVISSQSGAKMYLKDFAQVVDTVKETESYARLAGKNVITLNVIKRAGENLISASDKIKETIEELKKTEFPSNIDVKITADQSDKTKLTLHDLINTIIIGFILVTLILMFFMGVTNALFVALSVPLSMFIAFIFMPSIGFSMNMIVLFAFLLALGIVVDDAIVVIENTHRIFDNGKVDIKTAAKKAAGEVFLPVLSGTITTLAPFIPLAFWPGIIGKFMFFLPITLIITLLASLFVAYIINPVFAVDFMKPHHEEFKQYGKITRKAWLRLLVYALIAVICYVAGHVAFGNLMIFFALFMVVHRLFLYKVIENFQTKAWPSFQRGYTNLLVWGLKRPYMLLVYTLVLFAFSIFLMKVRSPNVVFFPQGDPNNVFVYVKLPEGTDPAKTNEVMKIVEKKVNAIIGENNPIVSSMITNVTIGVTDPQDEDQSSYANRGKIAINFVEFSERNGESTMKYLKEIQATKWNIAGAEITANKEQAGPPVGKPINIEITGDKFEELVDNAQKLKRYLQESDVPGVAELKTDFVDNKPEIVFDVDRERANREGISSAQLAMEIRKAVFGIDNPSKFRDANDEYPIQLRYNYDQRTNIEQIKNLKITFRDMNMMGMIRSVPLSSFCDVRYENTYGGIKRKQNKRVITLSSDVLEGFNPNNVVAQLEDAAKGYRPTGAVEVKFTGQQEEQAETGAFLGSAMMTSIGIILLVLVIQFNSIGKPIIILSEIVLSVIGVLLGTAIFKMDMSIVMTGIGIVALAGIVVRNGILLVEFAEEERLRGVSLYEAIVDAGRTRMTPVVLTATAAILGLIPLAVGLNIDFEGLLAHGAPHIHFGGDNVVFWGPLSWTMIFGLGFATFLTLLLVPAMYLIAERLKRKAEVILAHYDLPKVVMYVPFFVAVCQLILWIQKKKLDYGNLDR
ncbi:MAG: efflux transporter permease subunit [Bacteroidetes bacterium]|jgi:multidrug efflux pump subunit AcrB|nr:efflux transporter permease subunit [Bacteroidota bacterium]MDF2453462.1 efflux transporter permease subunit [Bacteroidota bacterium]